VVKIKFLMLFICLCGGNFFFFQICDFGKLIFVFRNKHIDYRGTFYCLDNLGYLEIYFKASKMSGISVFISVTALA